LYKILFPYLKKIKLEGKDKQKLLQTLQDKTLSGQKKERKYSSTKKSCSRPINKRVGLSI
jgi:glutathione peroxidase-family protein